MTVEELIKSDSGIGPAKRTVLNIMFTYAAISDRFNEILKPFELSVEQFNVLRILRGQKGVPANMCLIQERMLARTSNTTRLVDKLLAKGLVTRNICSENRRKTEVGITEDGLRLLLQLDPLIESFESGLVSNLSTEELKSLNQYLENIRT